MDTLLLVLVGLLVGFVGGYSGIGGAPIMVVYLTMVLGYDQHLAQGTVLAVLLAPISLLGIIPMKQHIKKYLPYAMIGVATYSIFSYVGAIYAFYVDPSILKKAFSILLIAVGLRGLLFRNHFGPFHLKTNLTFKNVAIVGAFVGIMSGFFGIGAGILMIPIFINYFELEKDDARLLSLLVLVPPSSIGAVLKYAGEGKINFNAALIIFLTYFLTNYFGSRLAVTHSSKIFRRYYQATLVIIGIIYII